MSSTSATSPSFSGVAANRSTSTPASWAPSASPPGRAGGSASTVTESSARSATAATNAPSRRRAPRAGADARARAPRPPTYRGSLRTLAVPVRSLRSCLDAKLQEACEQALAPMTHCSLGCASTPTVGAESVSLHERTDCECGCGGGWTERAARHELSNVLARVRAGVWRRDPSRVESNSAQSAGEAGCGRTSRASKSRTWTSPQRGCSRSTVVAPSFVASRRPKTGTCWSVLAVAAAVNTSRASAREKARVPWLGITQACQAAADLRQDL